jgi:hypothetical protein
MLLPSVSVFALPEQPKRQQRHQNDQKTRTAEPDRYFRSSFQRIILL